MILLEIKKAGGFGSDECCYPKNVNVGTKNDPKDKLKRTNQPRQIEPATIYVKVFDKLILATENPN